MALAERCKKFNLASPRLPSPPHSSLRRPPLPHPQRPQCTFTRITRLFTGLSVEVAAPGKTPAFLTWKCRDRPPARRATPFFKSARRPFLSVSPPLTSTIPPRICLHALRQPTIKFQSPEQSAADYPSTTFRTASPRTHCTTRPPLTTAFPEF